MSKAPTPPATPNPFMMSGAESKANIASAIANARLNDINQITPYGTVTYSFGTPVAGATGAPAGTAPAAAAIAPDPRLAGTNQIRQRFGLSPLVPGTPQYNQWLLSQNLRGGGWGPPGAAQGGAGM